MAGSRLIAVDIGNSSTKVGWFGDLAALWPEPVGTRSFATGDAPPQALLEALPQERCLWHVASVHREGTRILTDWIAGQRPEDDVHVLSFRDLPIEVRVDFPERVGLDRLAAAVAAGALREQVAGTLRVPLPDDGTRSVPITLRPAIVVDAGSAITVDLVSADGSFGGGVILPGFRMAAEALFGAADQLPLALLAPEAEPPAVVGKNTEAAIRSGLFWGAVGAVRELVGRMASELDTPPQVFVTGGDLRQLAKHIGHEARFVPNMVLAGIAIAARLR